MKLRHFTLPVAVILAAGCSSGTAEDEDSAVNPSVSEAISMPPCGTALQTWNGTTAYSNGPYTATGTSCAGVGSYGYRYQCVELVMRHFTNKWNLRWYGNAKDLLANAPKAYVDVYYNGDAQHPPVPGDMVVWKQGTYGHVALVTSVTSNSVQIIEQNVGGNGAASLPYANGSIGARWSTWVPAGWAHAKANANSNPNPNPIAWSCANSSYAGQQFWTCSNGDLYTCQNDQPQKTSCDNGCYPRSAGTNDLCIKNDPSWSCSSSAYGGSQWWTCSLGQLHKCVNDSGVKVACPNGCAEKNVGTNDTCL